MKKSLLAILLLCLIMALVGCRQETLQLPKINENSVIVTHLKTPLLTIIDLAQKQIMHEEPLDFVIHALARVDHDELVLATTGESSVRLLDLTDGTLQTIDILSSEVTCLYVEQSRELLFIADAENDAVYIYNLETESIVEQIKVAGHPNAIDVVDQFLYVLNGNAASISVIDLTTYEVVRTFPVVGHPTSLVVTGDHVWVGGHGAAGELNKHVYIYEADSGELQHTIQTGTMPIALYSDAYSTDMFVLSHGSNELHVIDTETMTVKSRVTTEDNPFYIQGDEQSIYVTALDGDRLTVIDREHYEVTEHYKLAPGPYGIVLGGDRR